MLFFFLSMQESKTYLEGDHMYWYLVWSLVMSGCIVLEKGGLAEWHFNLIGDAFNPHQCYCNHSYHWNHPPSGLFLRDCNRAGSTSDAHPSSLTKVNGSEKRYRVTHCFR